MQSLAVKYRPQTIEELVSQKSVVKILLKQLQTGNIKNCYLFCGPSGVGKTTVARAFAKRINNGQGEPIEIDAASNSGVDNVREIIKQAQERSIDSKYKIILIDECHALSNQAWQAFLKCIEEPPKFTIFMFCTTDPQKIPQTIVNRVQRFNLTKIETPLIVERLKYICSCEHISFENSAIDFIAKISDGGMRTSIANMEKCIDYGELTESNVLECLGLYSYSQFFNIVNSIIDKNEKVLIDNIDSIYSSGSDLKLFVNQFISFCMDLFKYSLFKSVENIKIPSSMKKDLDYSVDFDGANNFYNDLTEQLLKLKVALKDDTSAIDTVEISLLNFCR